VNALISWLEREPRGWQTVGWVLLTLLAHVILTFLGLVVVVTTGTELPRQQSSFSDEQWTLAVAVFLFAAAFGEEVLFRLPLALFARQRPARDVMIGALLLPAVFGRLHGSAANVLLQGAGGLAYSVLFLKCGGCQGRPLKGLLASTTAHWGFNALLFQL
jgi:membrane protease YdiL (CAAX protease family)